MNVYASATQSSTIHYIRKLSPYTKKGVITVIYQISSHPVCHFGVTLWWHCIRRCERLRWTTRTRLCHNLHTLDDERLAALTRYNSRDLKWKENHVILMEMSLRYINLELRSLTLILGLMNSKLGTTEGLRANSP